MVTMLPMPIEFALPAGWRPLSPDDAGVPRASFVAVHLGPQSGFAANITISGEFAGGAALADVADHALEALRAVGADVELSAREEVGSAEAPGIAQIVRMTAEVNGSPTVLMQSEVYLSFADVNAVAERALLRMVFTATVEQFDSLLPDFQYLVWTVRSDGAREN